MSIFAGRILKLPSDLSDEQIAGFPVQLLSQKIIRFPRGGNAFYNLGYCDRTLIGARSRMRVYRRMGSHAPGSMVVAELIIGPAEGYIRRLTYLQEFRHCA